MKTVLLITLLFYVINTLAQTNPQGIHTTTSLTRDHDNPITNILIKRWKQSKKYTLAILDAMPEDHIEYSPLDQQMSFAQHFIHIGFINNSFIGILMDSKTYPDFLAHKEADFFIDRPDPIHLFQPDSLQKRDAKTNKKLVAIYLSKTFDYVISSLEKLNDEQLIQGIEKEKPRYLKGHTNLDLILRGESHTAHHRAQAVLYLRMNNILPPEYSKHNTL